MDGVLPALVVEKVVPVVPPAPNAPRPTAATEPASGTTSAPGRCAGVVPGANVVRAVHPELQEGPAYPLLLDVATADLLI